MRRVLAAAGASVFFSLLAATRLPTKELVLLGFGVLVLAGCSLFRFRKGRRAYIPLVLFACGLSLLYKFSYDEFVLAPVQALNEETKTVQATVQEVGEGYFEDSARLQLKVYTVEGYEHLSPFVVEVNGMQAFEVNDFIELSLHFEALGTYDDTLWQYADGIYLTATAESEPVYLGKKWSLRGFFSVLQTAAAENIENRLPQRLASVLSAVSLGQTQGLNSQTTQAYRMAGLSHVLVVSGMHLAIVCFALNRSLLLLFQRKNIAVIGSLCGVFLFLVFTGFTPSMMRSAVACVLAFSAPLFARQADGLTSLGAAALLLCMLNPYAAVDVGFQFSLLATFGVLSCRQWLHKQNLRYKLKSGVPRRRLTVWLMGAFVTPVFATAFTLPVVVFNQLSFSLLSVPCNMLALPFLTPLVVGGFLLALPVGFAPLDFMLGPIALMEGAILAFLEALTRWSTSLPWLYPSVGGLFAFTVILLCFGLLVLAMRTRWKKTYCGCAVALFLCSMLFAQWQAMHTVTISVAGTGPQASLVVSHAGEAAVIYRGRNSLYDIEKVFEREGVRSCTLWVDLRKTAQTSEAERQFAPQKLYIATQELVYRDIIPALDGVHVYLLRQENGFLADVNIEGYQVGVANGALELVDYPSLDVLLASEAAVQAKMDYLLVSDEVPVWAENGQAILRNGGSATLLVRPQRSVVYKEASRDLFFSEMG